MSKQTFTYCLLLMGVVLQAQISFKAVVDKPEVKVGERFQLSYIINASEDLRSSSISLPNFKNFQVLGRNSGSNISYNNGELSRQYIESVVMIAQKPGQYKIPSARILWDGEVYLSNTVDIKVSKRSDEAVDNNKRTPVKMGIILSRDQAYPNQSIIAEIKLYAKSYDLLRRRSDIEVPGISGFQVTKISANEERNFQQESINGEVFVSEEIAQFQLKPTQVGDLEIPSFKIRLAIPLDFFDERIVLLKTEPKVVHVKELPKNAPKSFAGAIGSFKLNTIVDDADVKVNKPIDYEIELIGEGNLSNINLPEITVPTALELYPAKRRNAFKKTLEGEKGKIVDKYVIVPQFGGKYEIPAVAFSYFDPELGEYQTLYSEEMAIEVVGKRKENESITLSQDSLFIEPDSVKTDRVSRNVNELNEQVNQVKDYIQLPEVPDFDDNPLNKTSWYWLALIPIIGIAIFFVIKKRKKKLSPQEIQAQKDILAYKENVRLSLSDNIEALEIAKNHKNLNDFTAHAGTILNQVVSLFANESRSKVYTQAEASEILSTHTSERFLGQWEALHQKNQLMRYAGSISDESLKDLYLQYEALVKDSLNME